MSAIVDLRAMVKALIDHASARGDQWQNPGTPEYLMISAAMLMTGLVNALESTDIDFERVIASDLRRQR